MQKGFATLEIVLMIFIVGLLASCAVPNAVRIIDRVSLDYEVKRLYTDMRFLQSVGRMTNTKDFHFGTEKDEAIRLLIHPKRYVVENFSGKIYSEHYLSNGVTASKEKTVKFDDMGKIEPATSDTLNLTSRQGKELYFVFDSVGRFRGSREKPQ